MVPRRGVLLPNKSCATRDHCIESIGRRYFSDPGDRRSEIKVGGDDLARQRASSSTGHCLAVAGALVAVCLAWLLFPVGEAFALLAEWVRGRGAWGVLGFALVYIIVVVSLAPASALSIIAGAIFGAWGIPIVVVSAAIGANLAFLASRHLVRKRVEHIATRQRWFAATDRAIREEGWKIALLLRLSPLVPFGLQNYLMGATGITLRAYAAATLVGIVPGTALYVYLGTLGHAAIVGEGVSAASLVLMAAGLGASVYAIVIVGRKAKARLRDLGVRSDQAAEPAAHE